jgi:hypothetical protein
LIWFKQIEKGAAPVKNFAPSLADYQMLEQEQWQP